MFNQLKLWNGTLRKQFDKEIFDKEIPVSASKQWFI